MCACVHQLLYLDTLRTMEEEKQVAERRGFILTDSLYFPYQSKEKTISESVNHRFDSEIDEVESANNLDSRMAVRVPQCTLKR